MSSTTNDGHPSSCNAAETDGEQLLLMERAVSLVQQHWRTRRRHASQPANFETCSPEQLGEQPENAAEVVQLAKRICVNEAKAQAARQIQKRWRRYREAVEALGALDADALEHHQAHDSPDAPSQLGSSAAGQSPRRGLHRGVGSNRDLADLCEFLEHNLFDNPRVLPSCSSGDDDTDISDEDACSIPVAGVKSASHSSSRSPTSRRDADDEDINSIINSILSTAGDFEEELDSRDSMIRDCAAIVIQRYVRRWQLRRRHHAGPPDVESSAELSERVINALRVLQSRFRLQRIRRMVQDRDRNELVTRLQQLWRRRRELQRHFTALRRGREEAAARNIQRAYIRHRSKRHQERDGDCVVAQRPMQPVRAVRSLPPVNTIPCCIICMCEVVQIAFLPCGHAHTCVECGSQCQRCPTCRKVVALQVRIYL